MSRSHILVDKFFRSVDRNLGRIFGSYESERWTNDRGELVVNNEPHIHLHWQNLNDNERGQPKGAPYSGRFWVKFRGERRQRPLGLEAEWNLKAKHHIVLLGVEVSGHGGGDHDLSFSFSLKPVSLHLAFENVFPEKFRQWWKAKYRYAEREVRFGLSEDYDHVMGGLIARWELWANPMEWSSKDPKWKHGHIDFLDVLLGKPTRTERQVAKQQTKIPMPEGAYDAVVEVIDNVWARPRWPVSRSFKTSHIDVDIGIPHEGKGENDWDCGEDATFGLSCPASSVPEAVGKMVESVLRDRMKYDHNMLAVYPHPEARRKAIEARRAKKSPEASGV